MIFVGKILHESENFIVQLGDLQLIVINVGKIIKLKKGKNDEKCVLVSEYN